MTTRQLFIIDPRVTDCESLVSALPEGSEWVLLDAERDGVLQLREIMEAYQGLDSIQIFSHGAQGSLLLGNTILNSGNIESYAQMLAQIGASLGPEGDLLLYGCNVGQGDIGHAFIAQLAQLTGADVAASENVTGSASLGGDWVLEQTSGSVQASTMSAPTYAGTLDVIDGTPGDDVRVGTEFSDALNGFEGNDSLDGAGGTDTLIGGLGDDLLVGGVGHDIAMYAGVQVSYAITQNSNGVQVTAPEGTDTLQGIETVQFADATILVSFWGVGPAELRVNSTTADTQGLPAITALADGGWVATWVSNYQDGSGYGYGIFAQRYASNGMASGAEFRVNTYTDGDQDSPVITALADGGWVVTWRSYGQDGSSYGIYAQRYDAAGAASGAEFRVNTYATYDQSAPSVTALADGGWVVTWHSQIQDGWGYGIYAQRYASNGTASGTEFQVNSTTLNSQEQPAITALADGGWLVTWESYGLDGSDSHWSICAQRYASNGVASGPEIQVNSTTGYNHQYPATTALADGGWVVTWQSSGHDGSGYGIYAQRYASNGTASGTEFQVNSTTLNSQEKPAVAALADGGWLVTWQSSGQDGSGYGIYAQRYASNGTASGTEFQVNSTTLNSQEQPEITALADGGWLVTWESYGQDGSSYGIYAQRYNAAGEQVGAMTLDITGDATSQRLTGASSGDTINGLAGDDTLDGGTGADTLIGGTGNDLFLVDNSGDVVTELNGEGADEVRSSVSYVLLAHVENLTLTGAGAFNGKGNTLDNVITGNGADNTLDGGAGADTLIGGSGNDVYLVDNAGDVVTELPGEGTDEVRSSVSYTLGANLENLTLSGSAAIDGTGNTLNNMLTGNSADNTLDGGTGADTLNGGAGADTLIGGAGDDRLIGGDGLDVASYSGIYASYTVSQGPTGAPQVSGSEGSDTLQGIETLGFSDATVQVSFGGVGPAEFRVNTYTTNDQTAPAVTALADGGWVVTWQSQSQDGSDYGIYAQRYNAAGTASGVEFQVNTYTTWFQIAPSVTALADGGWVVTWQSFFQDVTDGINFGIYAQRYNAAGTATGAEFRVNTYTTNDQNAPSVTALADGGWVVTWQSYGQDGSVYGIYGQRYNAAGTASGAEFWVNTYTNDHQSAPSVTALADGGWVVTWQSYQDGWGHGIYAQRYNAAGTATGAEFRVNTYTTNDQSAPSVTALADGGWVVTWHSEGQDEWGYGIYAQRYNAAGTASGVEFQVNTYTTNDQYAPSVTALSDGGWVVTWQSSNQDGWSTGIYAQRYTAAGTASGVEFQVNTYTTSNQDGPSVTALADGGWVVTWQSLIQDGSGYGIYAQRYDAAGAGVGGLTLDITGDASSQYLTGAGYGDTISGLAGDDTLDGGTGADTLIGGTGNDQYLVDNSADVVTELNGDGTDEVRSSVSYVLLAHVENLTLTGAGAFNGKGNTLDNVITGNGADNTLDGGAGADTLIGGAGNDVYVVDNSGDVVTELPGEGTDEVRSSVSYTLGANLENLTLTGSAAIDGTGNALNNVLTGNSGDNLLDGGAGVDTMIGGTGNDIYIVDNAGDVVTELTGEGTDAIRSSVTNTLSLNVEKLTLTGAAAINGTGNVLDNVVSGNGADNTLDGGAGADTLSGGAGNDLFMVDNTGDVVIEQTGEGTDEIRSSVSYTLSANVEKLTLIGSAGAIDGIGNELDNVLMGTNANNRLEGRAGADTLIGGGGGADTMVGGTGDDTYWVYYTGDVVVELNGGGTDLVQSAVSYSLSRTVENLTLLGTNDLIGNGNYLANRIQGNAGANTLSGWDGDDTLMGFNGTDTLNGGFGNDVLIVQNGGNQLQGGWGADTFAFQQASNYENEIKDFTAGDFIQLEDLASIASVGAGDGATVGLGQVQYQVESGRTTLWIGMDSLAGADAVLYLDGFTNVGDLRALGNRLSVHPNASPTGSVTITGTATQGQTLTASNTLVDTDGIPSSGPGAISYQWLRNGSVVDGATAGSYVLTQADVGKPMSVRVSYTDGMGTAEAVTSDATASVANVNDLPSGTVSITGTAIQGQTLSTDTTTLADLDGLGTLGYQWLRGGNAIASATSASYSLVQADVGAAISVRVSYTDALGTAETVTSAASGAVANINDAPSGGVTISGTPNQGQVLSAVVSTLADADGIGTLSYQWKAGGIDISGAIAGSYTLTAGEVGKTISVTVSYTDLMGTAESVTSAATANVAVPANLTLTGTAGAETLNGDMGNDSLSGLGGNDTLNGFAGNDTLNGGTGTDSLVGGEGGDLYLMASAAEHSAAEVSDSGATGSDEVRFTATSAGTLSLFAGDTGIERVVIGTGTGATAITSATTALNVNAAAVLNALSITGNAGANTLTGTALADTLDGGAGVDSLVGGGGNDTYIVDNTADVVTESSSTGGTDLVQASVSYTLGTNVENLTLIGAAAINATGNTAANLLTGNAAANILTGAAGADTMDGADGADLYLIAAATDHSAAEVINDSGASGIDEIRFTATTASTLILSAGISGIESVVIGTGTAAAAVTTGTTALNVNAAAVAQSLAITGNDGANTLTGSAFADTLSGGLGNDTLIGGAGADSLVGGGGTDSMSGGAGDDTYGVDATTDIVNESVAGSSGIDTVQSSVTYSLNTVAAASVEHLTLTGTSAINATGNALANILTGNSGANNLSGGDGDDTLIGGAGNDTLTGGNGLDTASYAGTAGAVTVSLALATAQVTGGAGTDTLATIEHLIGGNGNDSLSGSTGDNRIDAGLGNDTVNGGAGNDTLIGGDGIDTVVYSSTAAATTVTYDRVSGIFTVSGADGVDTVSGMEFFRFADTTLTAAELATIQLTGGDDSYVGDGTDERIDGLAGNDTIEGAGGADRLFGGEGQDTAVFSGNRSDYTVTHVGATFVVAGADGVDTLSGIETLQFDDTTIELPSIASLAATSPSVSEGQSGSVALSFTVTLDHAASTDQTLDYAVTGSGANPVGADDFAGGALPTGTLSIAAGEVSAIITIQVGGDEVPEYDETLTLSLSNPSSGLVLWSATATGTLLNDDGTLLTPNADTYNGTAGADKVLGLGGNDTLSGLGGNDQLDGGFGDDSLDGGTGVDTLLGGMGNDTYVVDDALDGVSENADEGTDTVQSALTWTLGANLENLTLTGTAALNGTGNERDNGLNGNTGANVLDGFAGNDTLNGGTGTDSLLGGEGGDLYLMASAGEHAAAEVSDSGATGSDEVRFTATSAGTLSLFAGDTGIERVVIGTGTGATAITSATTALNVNAAAVLNALSITGNAGANTLTGTALADTLDGGAGVDSLVGGGGNDTYIVDNTADVVTESSSTGGTDLVQASVSYTLGTNVENLTLIGAAAINATGNTAANLLTGNAAANILTGAAGADTMDGADGADLYLIAAATDHSAAEVINDSGASGIDEIRFTATTASTLILSAGISGIESVVIGTGTAAAAVTTGTTALNVNAAAVAQSLAITGNDGANTLTGSAFADTLSGGLGNDTLIGGAGADSLVGGGGTDSMSGGAGDDTYGVDATTDIVNESVAGSSGIDTVQSSVTYSLNTVAAASVEHLTLTGTSAINATGNALANILTGNSGANNLSGGDGDDTLIGGAGNDTLTGGNGLDTASYAGTAGAVTVSLALATAQVTGGAGTDTLATIEHLIGGNGNDSLSGSTGDNRIDAGLGNDTVNGGAGNDTLIGGLGNDSLVGGTGADIFRFNTALGAGQVDTLSDFTVVDDTFQLDHAVFASLVALGVLSAGNFVAGVGVMAAEADDFILYDTGTGALLYDADGNGGTAAVQFATLVGIVGSLDAADFVVI